MFDAAGTLVQVYDATSNIRTDYVSGPNGGLARIKRVAGVDEVSFIHADWCIFCVAKIARLGTGRVGTSWGGAQEWEDWHTPFGESLIHPDATDDQSDYTGHIRDKATGLTYMQARYYDPVIGRFLGEDPVDFIGSGGNPAYFNRYAYSGNDPINNIDPDGEFFQVVGFALGVASNVAIQTLVEGKSLGEVNVVEALTSGVVGATGLGAVSQGAKAIKAVRGAKQVSKS